MLYQLEQGPKEKFIREQSERYGTPLPEKIANAPTLEYGLMFYFSAFKELNTCRGFSGSIPYTSIQTYCYIHEIVGVQQEELFFHIREMESVLTKYTDRNNKTK